MLLYEALLREALAGKIESGEAELLEKATVVLTDNVSDFYYQESPQEFWRLDQDFPNVAPPWPIAFYEWRIPKLINSEGVVHETDIPRTARFGLLMAAEPIDQRMQKMTPEERAKRLALATINYYVTENHPDRIAEFAEQMEGISIDDLFAQLPPEKQQQYRDAAKQPLPSGPDGDARWAVNAVAYVWDEKNSPLGHTVFKWPVSERGTLFTHPVSGKVAVSISPHGHWGTTEDMHRYVRTQMYRQLHVPFLAISLSHCRNVELTAVDPPEKLSRKQLKRYGVPKVRYHVLEISPMRKVLREEGQSQKHGLQKSLHICRGHFKDYRERGLFGRNKGIYWWDMHVRGSAESGVVVKDYNVSAGNGGQR